MKRLFLLTEQKYFFIGLLIVILAIWIQSHPAWDYGLESLFYNSQSHTWWIEEKGFSFKFLLYTLPKIALIVVSLFLLFRYSKSSDPIKWHKIGAFLACMALIPSLISLLKANTNIHCPYSLQEFNGKAVHRGVLDFNSYTQFLYLFGNGNCFPAGHASGGYAFMACYFVLSEKFKFRGILFGFLLGTYMGFYQMMKGAHFLSHTLFTLGFSCMIISLVTLIISSQETKV